VSPKQKTKEMNMILLCWLMYWRNSFHQSNELWSKIGGMCMSEPNAGTDVLGMRSNAVYDAARDGYVLNGTKVWWFCALFV
jgi:hypothetical protein